MRLQTLGLFAGVAVASLSCSENSGPSPNNVQYAISSDSGDSQVATAGDTLGSPIVARVTNSQTGAPVQGVTVNWKITAGRGVLTSSQSATDANGRARVEWVLGSALGAQTSQASAPKSPGSQDSVQTGFDATAYGVGALHFVGVFDGDSAVAVSTPYDVTQHYHFIVADAAGDSITSVPVVNLPAVQWQLVAGLTPAPPPACTPGLDVTTLNCPATSGDSYTGHWAVTVQQGSFDGIANPAYRGAFTLRVGPDAPATVAFMSDRVGGDWQIWVLHGDGTQPTQLTTTPTAALHPRWSWDGSSILYYATVNGVTNVYKMAADGTGQTRLTTNQYGDGHPAWSPTGAQIAYQCGTAHSEYDICVMNQDGTGIQNITNSAGNDQNPDWSRDGQWIAWECEVSGVLQVCKMHPDGTDAVQLTATGVNRSPAWSPDGNTVLFTSERDGNAELYTMKSDGSNQTRITNDPAADDFGRWLPDGRTIVFSSSRSGRYQLYTMSPTGSTPVLVASSAGNDQAPDWK